MSGFAVRMAIDTPISLQNLLHLDGLLGSIVTKHGKSHTDIPLNRVHGVWQGSAALLETGAFGAVKTSITRLKHVVDTDVPAVIFNHLKLSDRKIGEMSQYRNLLTTYPCMQAVKAVWFAGNGNGDEVLGLLREVFNLGAMGRTGYGRVCGLELFTLQDSEWNGLVLGDGMPSRVIPLPVWHSLGFGDREDVVVAPQRFEPPYWSGPEVDCVLPAQTSLIGTGREIRAKLGVH